ncbi:MAG TPA: PEGA domain-containing protein [Polyangiaceae bacterium]|nr:PEGA domain-containing protein [Polyangiaceae bacterium]
MQNRRHLALAGVLTGLTLLLGVPSCLPQPRAAVSLRLKRAPKTPADALVTIDEEFIGPLAYVAAHGVRLPSGTHRITVERTGFFPYDTVVTANNDPIFLDVQLTPVPD